MTQDDRLNSLDSLTLLIWIDSFDGPSGKTVDVYDDQETAVADHEYNQQQHKNCKHESSALEIFGTTVAANIDEFERLVREVRAVMDEDATVEEGTEVHPVAPTEVDVLVPHRCRPVEIRAIGSDYTPEGCAIGEAGDFKWLRVDVHGAESQEESGKAPTNSTAAHQPSEALRRAQDKYDGASVREATDNKRLMQLVGSAGYLCQAVFDTEQKIEDLFTSARATVARIRKQGQTILKHSAHVDKQERRIAEARRVLDDGQNGYDLSHAIRALRALVRVMPDEEVDEEEGE